MEEMMKTKAERIADILESVRDMVDPDDLTLLLDNLYNAGYNRGYEAAEERYEVDNRD
jgi:hypothetical protein